MPVYFIQASDTAALIKIGFARNVRGRLAKMRVDSPVPLSLVGQVPGSAADERALHQRFAQHRVRGEWFRPADELREFILGHAINDDTGPRRRGRRARARQDSGLERAIEKAGGVNALASLLGLKHCSVSLWRRIPVDRAKAVRDVLNIPLHEIRPDVWAAPGEAAVMSYLPTYIALGTIAYIALALIVARVCGMNGR